MAERSERIVTTPTRKTLENGRQCIYFDAARNVLTASAPDPRAFVTPLEGGLNAHRNEIL